MKANLSQRLKGETYLDQGTTTREWLIENQLLNFENNLKRTFNIAKRMEPQLLYIPRLKGNSRKGFEDDVLYLTKFVPLVRYFVAGVLSKCREEVAEAFLPRLVKIGDLIEAQKEEVEEKGHI